MEQPVSSRDTSCETETQATFRSHKNVLCQIDAKRHNGHGLPLSSELMRDRTSHRGTELPVAAMRLVRDGEVPFIR